MLDLEPTSRVYVLKLAVFCDGSRASFLSDFKQRDEHFAVVDVLYLHHIHTSSISSTQFSAEPGGSAENWVEGFFET